MNGDQILHFLRAFGLTFTDIAQALGVTPQHVGQVAHRKGDSTRIAKALAIALNKPVEEVFPDRPQYTAIPIQRSASNCLMPSVNSMLREATPMTRLSISALHSAPDSQPSNPKHLLEYPNSLFVWNRPFVGGSNA
ncbi:MAG: helix-turn-helix domain-containing protein [Candidatus Thiodiazotropha sp. (ex Lucinoma borealis)]|nr:helix-turn-helix domain-containing protein [Candidatus Thiodiazotropha sp. (ex Lucinoma borealis)]